MTTVCARRAAGVDASGDPDASPEPRSSSIVVDRALGASGSGCAGARGRRLARPPTTPPRDATRAHPGDARARRSSGSRGGSNASQLSRQSSSAPGSTSTPTTCAAPMRMLAMVSTPPPTPRSTTVRSSMSPRSCAACTTRAARCAPWGTAPASRSARGRVPHPRAATRGVSASWRSHRQRRQDGAGETLRARGGKLRRDVVVAGDEASRRSDMGRRTSG